MPLQSTSVTLDQLVALNDEMAALVRAGVPLDRGLLRLGEDLPGGLGRLARAIGQRLESGQSLVQIVSQTDGSFPPLYRAVVEAGIRSGRLAIALEGLSTSARRVAELRRLVGISLIYPLAVLTTVYGVGLFCFISVVPTLGTVGYEEFGLGDSLWLDWMHLGARVMQTLSYWPLVIVAIVLGMIWYRSGRFASAAESRWWMRWMPNFNGLLHTGRMAAFADILALLVDQEVPLDAAVVLAADASGDAQLQRSSGLLAEQIRRGGLASEGRLRVAGIPPLLTWLISSGYGARELCGALRHMAETYRARVQRMTDWLLVYIPIIISVGIGGSATIILAISVLGPWFNLLYQLGQS